MANSFKRLLFFLLLVCFISFVSCGGGDSDPDPDQYFSYEGVNGNESDRWTGGVLPQNNGPFATVRTMNGDTYCLALKTTINDSDIININDLNHVRIIFNGSTGPLSGTSVSVRMRIGGLNSSNPFTLSNQYVEITRYSGGYIEGNYSGQDFNSKPVNGSFVFKHVGNNNWPIAW